MVSLHSIITDSVLWRKNNQYRYGKIEYTKNNEICKVANNQKLVFTLRIFNEGEKHIKKMIKL